MILSVVNPQAVDIKATFVSNKGRKGTSDQPIQRMSLLGTDLGTVSKLYLILSAKSNI